jgi:hypothetical protein
MKKILLIVMFLGIIMGGVFMASETRALSLLDDTLIQEAACTGKCTLNSFISLGINLSNIILGVVGALTLVMFIYGGVVLVLSGGNSEKVTKGKEIILGSVVGLLIVFGSYSIISFVINDVFEAKVNGQNAFTGEAPKDTYIKQTENACSKQGGTCKKPCALGDTTLNDSGYCGKTSQFCCKTGSTECANNGFETCAAACGGTGTDCVISGKTCSGSVPQRCCRLGAGCSY